MTQETEEKMKEEESDERTRWEGMETRGGNSHRWSQNKGIRGYFAYPEKLLS